LSNGEPKEILMAEQLKISSYKGVEKLIKLYSKNVEQLDDNIERYLIDNINTVFSVRYDGSLLDTVNDIRDYYNNKIMKIFKMFEKSDVNRIMSQDKVYGVYFFSQISGVDGFLVKTEDDGVKNFNYEWKLVKSQWGLYRIKLLFTVNPNAYRYVWVGNEETFYKTFRLNNINEYKSLKNKTINNPQRLNITIQTDNGILIWCDTKGYWITDYLFCY
jgi:hypothetical protein